MSGIWFIPDPLTISAATLTGASALTLSNASGVLTFSGVTTPEIMFSGANARLFANGSVIIGIDKDNNSGSESFLIRTNNTTDVFGVDESGNVTAGLSAATGGLIRIPNNAALVARNAANTANVSVIEVTVGNQVFISSDNFDIRTGSGKVLFNDTSNVNMTTGLTINQGSADDEILALKSSDVAHGITSDLETDTFGRFRKRSAALGGLQVGGFLATGSGGQALTLLGAVSDAVDSTKATTSSGAVQVEAQVKSGTTLAAIAANANMFAVSTGGTTRFILDADGDSHQDVGTAWTNFDSHDDLDILNSLAYRVSRSDDPWKDHIRRYFAGALDSMLTRDQMQRMKLVTFNRDGHHFVNMSKLTMLHTGAIRQLGNRMLEAEDSRGQMQDQIDQLAKQNVRLLRSVQRLERRLN